MQRTGRLNMPSYRIVVVEHTAGPKDGRFVEKVGAYNPKTKERTLNEERVKYWMSVGAKPSDTVHNMLVTLGIINAKKINVLPKKSPPKPAPAEASEKEEVAEEKPAESAASVDEETPAEKVPAEDKMPEEQKVAAADGSGEEKKEAAPAETPAEEPKEAETKPE
ncbi:MAG: 30S ribosomal protein S16 [Patescibacteria group bacterium]|nr:30S ribosomal protein S16 [Patescibacteria group bacterium]